MTERESIVHDWIKQVSVKHEELGGFAVCPYASGSDTLIKDTPIDDIVSTGMMSSFSLSKIFGNQLK